MNAGPYPSVTKTSTRACILLMDGNSERRALRTRIMTLHGVEVVGAYDLTEAASIWNRDRYDMVLIDMRRDYRGCVAWRDEIKKESPQQVVAFLVGRPRYIGFAPLESSFVVEAHSTERSDSLRLAIRKGCEGLPQRNGLAEAILRISAVRKINGANSISDKTALAGDIVPDAQIHSGGPQSASGSSESTSEPTAGKPDLLQSFAMLMENE